MSRLSGSPMVRAGLGAIALAAVVVAASACASTSSGSSGLGSVANPPASSTPSPSLSMPAGPPQSTAPSATASSPATPTVGPCVARHLKVTAKDPDDGAAGTIVQRFVMTNTDSATCTMNKWPFISAYGPKKQGGTTVEANLGIKTGHVPTTFGSFGGAGGKQTLSHNGSAVFFLKWNQVPTGGSACPQADGFDFRPPADPSADDQILVKYKFTPCAVDVSQVFPPSKTD